MGTHPAGELGAPHRVFPALRGQARFVQTAGRTRAGTVPTEEINMRKLQISLAALAFVAFGATAAHAQLGGVAGQVTGQVGGTVGSATGAATGDLGVTTEDKKVDAKAKGDASAKTPKVQGAAS